MSIDAANAWHDAAMARVKAIEQWINAGKPLPYDTKGEGQEHARELNKSLLPLLQDYQSLKKTEAMAQLKKERDDIRKVALVRLFSGFEAEFQSAFAERMKLAWDKLDPDGAPSRDLEAIRQTIPKSIELCLILFRALEPHFSGADKAWLDEFRGWRNDVLHGGFVRSVDHDFKPTYKTLKRIIQLLRPAIDPAE